VPCAQVLGTGQPLELFYTDPKVISVRARAPGCTGLPLGHMSRVAGTLYAHRARRAGERGLHEDAADMGTVGRGQPLPCAAVCGRPGACATRPDHGRRGMAALTAAARATQAFQNYIKLILLRKNTINGVVYNEDPTIMAVELANEPHTRCAAPAAGLPLGGSRAGHTCSVRVSGVPGAVPAQLFSRPAAMAATAAESHDSIESRQRAL